MISVVSVFRVPPLPLISRFPTVPREIHILRQQVTRFKVKSFPQAQVMATQFSGTH